jgi:hypothetical protein
MAPVDWVCKPVRSIERLTLGKGVLGRCLAGFFIVYTDIGWLCALGVRAKILKAHLVSMTGFGGVSNAWRGEQWGAVRRQFHPFHRAR